MHRMIHGERERSKIRKREILKREKTTNGMHEAFIHHTVPDGAIAHGTVVAYVSDEYVSIHPLLRDN